MDLLELGADQLADAIESADADAVRAVDVGRDAGKGCVGVGLAADLEDLGLDLLFLQLQGLCTLCLFFHTFSGLGNI